MTKNTTDEQMKHYNKIIEQFDSVHMPAKQREIIMTEIEQLISNREKLARIDEWDYIHETMHSANIRAQMYIDEMMKDRITSLRKELDGGQR